MIAVSVLYIAAWDALAKAEGLPLAVVLLASHIVINRRYLE